MGMTILEGNVIIIGKKESTGGDYIGKIVFTNGTLETAIYYHIVQGRSIRTRRFTSIKTIFCCL